MPIEVAAIIATVVGLFVTTIVAMFAGFGWIIRRIDGVKKDLEAQIGAVDRRQEARSASLENKLGARIDAVEDRLGARIDTLDLRLREVKDEVTEVKIAVARLEGPPPRLVLAR